MNENLSMKKRIIILIITILICVVFPVFHLIGTQAIIDLSSVVVGVIYIITSFKFFRSNQNKGLNYVLGCVVIIASTFAILPVLFYFLNSITFIININYNDILFNYYKADLNSLIGLSIFLIVYIIDSIAKIKTTLDEKEKRNFKLFLCICLIMLATVLVVILRKLGYHISFTKVLIKITLLLSVIVMLPYLFYSGLIKYRFFTLFFLIFILTLLNNVHPRYLFSSDFSEIRWLVYKNPVRQVSSDGIDTLKTIESFHKIGDNFYEITFSGDYSAILESNNKKCLEESINTRRFCSLFTSFGDSSHYLFSRNFDNPQGWKCKTLICRTNPINGYASLSLVRLADLNFDLSDDIENFSYEKKKPLINTVFYTPDGINEKGVVVALAAVQSQKLNEDTSKAYINCSYLIREILDHAKDIEEAMAIIKKYNIMNDVWSGTFDQHLLIADASGRSVIAEISNGEFQFIHNTANWQATTNSPSYNISFEQQKKQCDRFNAISSTLQTAKGLLTTELALKTLQKIGHQYTEWSTVYDISQRKMTVVIDYNFSKPYKFFIKN